MQKSRELDRQPFLSKRIWLQMAGKSLIAALPKFRGKTLLLLGLIFCSLLIQSGVLFNLVENPPLTGKNLDLVFNEDKTTPRNNLLYQYQSETLLVASFTGIGSFGLYLLKMAPSFVDDTSKASAVISAGILLIIVGLVAMYLLLSFKYYGSFDTLKLPW